PQALDHGLLQHTALRQLDRGGEDGARRRHEDRVDAAAEDLPDHEEHGDRNGADRIGAEHGVAQALRRREPRRGGGRAGGGGGGGWRGDASSLLSIWRSSARQAAKSGLVRTSAARRWAATGDSTMVRMRPGAVANTKMRSDSSSASSIEWVTKITVALVRDQIFRKSSCSCSRVWASSAPNGSSMKIRIGLPITSPPMPTPPRIPPP